MSDEIRIVLLGKTGHGKSATGNSILGEDVFGTDISLSSVTHKTACHTKKLANNRNLTVVDTPGLYDTNITEKDIKKEMIKCIGMSAPGPHAFLFVMKVGDKLTQEESDSFKQCISYFGQNLHKFVIFVFTHKSKLKNKTIEDYARTAPSYFLDILKLCDKRIISIENEGDKYLSDRKKTVASLLDMIGEMESRYDFHYYEHTVFQGAQTIIKKTIADGVVTKDNFRQDIQNEGKCYDRIYDEAVVEGACLILIAVFAGLGSNYNAHDDDK